MRSKQCYDNNDVTKNVRKFSNNIVLSLKIKVTLFKSST